MTNPTVVVDEVYWNPMVPELSVTDLTRSLAFYTGLLGFSVRYRRDDPPFAYLEQQQVQLMLEQVHLAGWQVGALEPPFGRGINLQMELTDIQPLLDRLQGAGIALFRQPTEVWYPVGEMLAGQREFLLQDPDGYLLRFVQYLGERAAD
ncbi:bleomycin resistance protein [Aeromonas veronii]|uniref:bleomycin resistance protein n=1 Tax=Aeromonas veronii TaxID=654 RepID=UPI0022476A18|nr:VOC family protein [Aeromonas veronii]EKP0303865.1 VOC family protein [Aeromonas veronii]MCX0431879.1 VOC family protein [Aeromonas veronii]